MNDVGIKATSCSVGCESGPEGRRSSTLAWRVDDGRIEGVEVSGLCVALLASTSDRETKWRAVIHVDERASAAQQDALLKLVTGQLGGAFAELATLIGEVSAIERSPIRLDLDGQNARLLIGASADA